MENTNMENTNMNQMSSTPESGNGMGKWIAVVVIIVVVALGYFAYKYYSTMKNDPDSIENIDASTKVDTTNTIESSIDTLGDDSDIDKDLESLDSELNTL